MQLQSMQACHPEPRQSAPGWPPTTNSPHSSAVGIKSRAIWQDFGQGPIRGLDRCQADLLSILVKYDHSTYPEALRQLWFNDLGLRA